MRCSLCLLALITLGCSAPENPATSRLKPGQMVIMAPKSGGSVVVDPPPGQQFPPDSPGQRIGTLAPGDTARVITDESTREYDDRPVTMVVVTASRTILGRNMVGTTCTASRNDLRAIKQQE